MRIVGGELRGRRLAAPADLDIRPTSDRAREAIFNILAGGRLGHEDRVAGARVLDVFAGTGAFGLEALSRGAAFATLLDNSAGARRLCRANIQALDLEGRTALMSGDALKPPATDEACDLVFLDPPYGKGLAEKAIAALERQGWIASSALVLVELDAKEEFVPPQGFAIEDDRRYGKARIVFLVKAMA